MSDVYGKLLSMVMPEGMFPEAMANVMVEATRTVVTAEQAQVMLENAERFEATFGPGSYAEVTARMTTAMVAPMVGAFEDLDREMERTADDARQ